MFVALLSLHYDLFNELKCFIFNLNRVKDMHVPRQCRALSPIPFSFCEAWLQISEYNIFTYWSLLKDRCHIQCIDFILIFPSMTNHENPSTLLIKNLYSKSKYLKKTPSKWLLRSNKFDFFYLFRNKEVAVEWYEIDQISEYLPNQWPSFKKLIFFLWPFKRTLLKYSRIPKFIHIIHFI